METSFQVKDWTKQFWISMLLSLEVVLSKVVAALEGDLVCHTDLPLGLSLYEHLLGAINESMGVLNIDTLSFIKLETDYEILLELKFVFVH